MDAATPAGMEESLAPAAALRHDAPHLHVVRAFESESVAGGVAAIAPSIASPNLWADLGGVRARRALWQLRCVVKRALDVIGAAAMLLVMSPLIAVIAVLVKLDSPGPVLFAHQRLGRGGSRFNCLKFRSMRMDAERLLEEDPTLRERYVTNHYKIPTDQDSRVTRFGRFLRKSSLDEVPQLWNVFVGDMSLVGPRPIVDEEARHYDGTLDELLSMRPGLSGAWAVHGRSRVGYPERADLELAYVRGWTILTDLVILARTPWAVVTGRGVE